MALQTRTAQLIDALIARMAAQPGYRLNDSRTTTAGMTTIWDGPEFRTSEDKAPGAHLIVGYSGDSATAVSAAATVAQTHAPIDAAVRSRDEVVTLVCRGVYDAAETPKLARDGALTTINDVAEQCRLDQTLGIDASATVGGVLVRCFVTAGSMIQYLNNGFTCDWEFTVTCRTRV